MIRLLLNLFFAWLDRRLGRLKAPEQEPMEQLPPGHRDAAPPRPKTPPAAPAAGKKSVLFPGLDDAIKKGMKGK